MNGVGCVRSKQTTDCAGSFFVFEGFKHIASGTVCVCACRLYATAVNVHAIIYHQCIKDSYCKGFISSCKIFFTIVYSICTKFVFILRDLAGLHRPQVNSFPSPDVNLTD